MAPVALKDPPRGRRCQMPAQSPMWSTDAWVQSRNQARSTEATHRSDTCRVRRSAGRKLPVVWRPYPHTTALDWSAIDLLAALRTYREFHRQRVGKVATLVKVVPVGLKPESRGRVVGTHRERLSADYVTGRIVDDGDVRGSGSLPFPRCPLGSGRPTRVRHRSSEIADLFLRPCSPGLALQ